MSTRENIRLIARTPCVGFRPIVKEEIALRTEGRETDGRTKAIKISPLLKKHGDKYENSIVVMP